MYFHLHSQFWPYSVHLEKMYRVTEWHISAGRSDVKSTYSSHNINDGDFLFRVVLVLLLGLFSYQGPQLVKVDGWHVVLVLTQVEVSHTNLE